MSGKDKRPFGYDYNWVLDESFGELQEVATVSHPNGRRLVVHSDQPGV